MMFCGCWIHDETCRLKVLIAANVLVKMAGLVELAHGLQDVLSTPSSDAAFAEKGKELRLC
ncbi:hypothetical protein P3T76_015127 [Phytophthora citrophthora]|uniref:Uncharacterized protein n=1 Tax=Phytophthora citrophthora TaxID=4793 RepID=A0AAD9LAJ1_9STRA|nr:hypothetical protein P3T76_015127 [Phytophthora citrophthora]